MTLTDRIPLPEGLEIQLNRKVPSNNQMERKFMLCTKEKREFHRHLVTALNRSSFSKDIVWMRVQAGKPDKNGKCPFESVAIENPSREKRYCEVTVWTPRGQDGSDNQWGGLKPCWDAMKRWNCSGVQGGVGVIWDDSSEWLKVTNYTVEKCKRGEERIVFVFLGYKEIEEYLEKEKS